MLDPQSVPRSGNDWATRLVGPMANEMGSQSAADSVHVSVRLTVQMSVGPSAARKERDLD